MIHNQYHIWTGANRSIMVSDESTKTLRQFKTKDDAINWLFLSGNKDAARKLHRTKL